jgi:four helix bundle protein
MFCADAGVCMAKKVDELPVYQHAVEFCLAIIEILARPALRKDRDLYDQISEAADSITANLEEGFEQPTDRAFANFVFIAKGSLGEVLGRLRTARRKKYITHADLTAQEKAGDALGRRIGGFILPARIRLQRPRTLQAERGQTPPSGRPGARA